MTDFDWPTFAWPCDRRDAHHPHRALDHGIMLPTNPPKAAYYDCPGVPAHPATMAGGAHKQALSASEPLDGPEVQA